MSALPKVEQRRGVRDVVRGEVERTARHGFGGRAQFELEALRFERADDPEANGAGEQAAHLDEIEKARGGIALNFEETRDDSKDGREMAEGNFVARLGESRGGKGLFGGDQKRFARGTTGAIGDLVGKKNVAELIEFDEAIRLAMRVQNEGQGRAAELLELRAQENLELGAGGDFAQLPRGFDPAGMAKAAGGERGVRQLPKQPMILRGH